MSTESLNTLRYRDELDAVEILSDLYLVIVNLNDLDNSEIFDWGKEGEGLGTILYELGLQIESLTAQFAVDVSGEQHATSVTSRAAAEIHLHMRLCDAMGICMNQISEYLLDQGVNEMLYDADEDHSKTMALAGAASKAWRTSMERGHYLLQRYPELLTDVEKDNVGG